MDDRTLPMPQTILGADIAAPAHIGGSNTKNSLVENGETLKLADQIKFIDYTEEGRALQSAISQLAERPGFGVDRISVVFGLKP
ncbi:MAG: hypothetical protein EON54_24625 [Alcaligenaceae bacterium]|nr:MAG: hypothetical protein EON54_24625 [Alcaligenaceae bacterium]